MNEIRCKNLMKKTFKTRKYNKHELKDRRFFFLNRNPSKEGRMGDKGAQIVSG
jgi:hypothetical protein